MTIFTKSSVTSLDGTTIGYRRGGAGRPLVLVHGGLLASQHFVELASDLAPDFDVIVPDRRGRGMSGPYRESDISILDQESADIRALCEELGATDLFGLSSGAIVGLHAAHDLPQITKLALSEPPLSLSGSVPLGVGRPVRARARRRQDDSGAHHRDARAEGRPAHESHSARGRTVHGPLAP